MEVIIFERESFNRLIDELTIQIVQHVERHYKQEEWIGEKDAKALLGISGRSTLQRLRDELKIEFSQFGRIIRYSRSSILKFLETNRRSLNRL